MNFKRARFDLFVYIRKLSLLYRSYEFFSIVFCLLSDIYIYAVNLIKTRSHSYKTMQDHHSNF